MTTRPHFHVGPHEIRRLDSGVTDFPRGDSQCMAGPHKPCLPGATPGPAPIVRLDSELTSGHDSSSLAGGQLAAAAAGIPPTADTSTVCPPVGVSAIPDEAVRDRLRDWRDEERRFRRPIGEDAA